MREYQPIEDCGIIGDLNSVALVSRRGSIDFMCFPDFDSPTVFAALLDNDKGGYFSIHPLLEDINHKQLYLPETNVLLTRFLSEEGIAEITDFMPEEEAYGGKEIIRRVACIKGEMRFRLECCPRFNYARSHHTITQVSDHELIFRSQGDDQLVLRLKSSIPLQHSQGDAYAEFTLTTGGMADVLLEEVDGNYGSIVAAPTFGLPEQLGVRGEHLGNFPQAFTHLGLISAAISLDKELNKHSNKENKL